MTPEEVLVLYGRAWFERDRDQRIDALRSACTEDIVFMDPGLGRLHGLEAVADMIGSYMNAPMEGHETEVREEHDRGMSGSGVSVEVVTPIESFHQFYRYSYIWHFSDGSSSGAPRSASRHPTDGSVSSRCGRDRVTSPYRRPRGSDQQGSCSIEEGRDV